MARTMNHGRRIGSVALACGGVFLLVLIVWAARTDNLWESLLAMVRTKWGLVTMVDLLIGLAIVGTWIALLEGRWWPTVGWIIGLACLGNLVTVVYFLLRLRAADSLSGAFLSPKRRTRAAPTTKA